MTAFKQILQNPRNIQALQEALSLNLLENIVQARECLLDARLFVKNKQAAKYLDNAILFLNTARKQAKMIK